MANNPQCSTFRPGRALPKDVCEGCGCLRHEHGHYPTDPLNEEKGASAAIPEPELRAFSERYIRESLSNMTDAQLEALFTLFAGRYQFVRVGSEPAAIPSESVTGCDRCQQNFPTSQVIDVPAGPDFAVGERIMRLCENCRTLAITARPVANFTRLRLGMPPEPPADAAPYPPSVVYDNPQDGERPIPAPGKVLDQPNTGAGTKEQ